MEDGKEFKTDTEVNGNSAPADETGFNISEQSARRKARAGKA